MNPTDTPALARLFHEPNRLAILAALCTAEDGLSFTALRETCNLTDGNLSRHLKALADEEIIVLDKRFVDRKPLTTATLTEAGLIRFTTYLDQLTDVLRTTRAALPAVTPDTPAAAPGLTPRTA